jgi:hypothetical protein
MNAHTFASFLEDPSKLRQIPYQDLKDLVEQYPYCQPLRVLLLQKSQMEGRPDFAANLNAAAAYLPDRALLYLLVREFQSLQTGAPLFNLEEEEERLELKALSEILAEREPAPPVAAPQNAPAAIMELFKKAEAEALAEKETQKEEEEEEFVLPEPLYRAPIAPKTPAPAPPPPPPAPQPKTAFASWDKRYERLRNIVSERALDIPAPPPSSAAKPVKAQELAKRSVEEKEDIISETLAALLARQGHTQRAIAMYEKLGLTFPEKSSFFALQIEKLKRK